MSFRAIAASIAMFLAGSTVASSQVAPLDSIRLAYDFTPGKSVTYRVVVHETLSLGSGTVQHAERVQIVTYRCVGIVEEGYVMALSTDDYVARESRDSLPAVTRTSHPWAERKLVLLMARDGRRIRLYSSADTTGASPTGPFQPLLLPLLGDSATYVGASGSFDTPNWMLDNAIPPAYWRGTIFRVVKGRADTLGLGTIAIDLDQAARSEYTPDKGAATEAVIASTSHHFFSPLLGVTVAGHVEQRNQLIVRLTDGRTLPALQAIVMDYEIVPNTTRVER